MNRTAIAACALALALTATTSGSAFGANYGGWAVKAPGQTYGNSLVVPAASKQRHMSGQKFRRGNRHTFRRGHRFRGGHRFRHRRHFRQLYFYGYAHYYGPRHYYAYKDYYLPYYITPYWTGYAQPRGQYIQPQVTYVQPIVDYQRAVPPRFPLPPGCRMIREYQTRVAVGGKYVDAYGDACLQADGSWKRGPAKIVPD